MRRRLSTALAALTTLTLALAAVFVTRPAAASTTTPQVKSGNPSCLDLGYDFGYKPQPEPPPSGTYTFPDTTETVTIDSDGTYFDWSSTIGIDAVIVKGGSNSNVYIYDPPTESYGDSDLSSPINPNNGNPYGLSHIEFCYDFEVAVSKTASTTFTRTYSWDIEKKDDAAYAMFTGDSVDHTYEVIVTKTGFTDSDWAVSGTITIKNPAPESATITGVADTITGGISPTPDCGVTFPYMLAAGGTLTCSYSAALPDGASRTNTADVTTSGIVGGGSGSAAVTFGAPATEVNESVNVTDTNGDSWQFSDTGSVTYDKTFTCDADEGEHVNTATITETGDSDNATVTVSCYELSVTKDAATSLTRTWTWDIDKVGDQTSLTLSEGQTFIVNYDVTVSAASVDSAWAVSGSIDVENPAPMAATINSVSDVVSSGIDATVDCGVAFPYSLAAGDTLTCTYTADLPNAADRTNTATATLQNTPGGTTSFTGSAAVSFADATVSQVDECIEVTDSQNGTLGTVCASDAPKTFEYSREVGPYDTCGQYEYTNVAAFTTNDSGTTGSDDHTVTINVPCQGCTLTQGYWKTHSREGPAPYDEGWQAIGSGEEDTLFFNTGKTWYQVFWTPPAGNAFYNLAHQYMAAKLNVLNGTGSTTAVDSALSQAEALFGSLGSGSTSLTAAQRRAAINLAATLDAYNTGVTGPGHCTE
jgi:hypothetical protein